MTPADTASPADWQARAERPTTQASVASSEADSSAAKASGVDTLPAGPEQPAGTSTADADPEFQNLALFRVAPGFRGRSGLIVLLWQCVQATLFAWSPQPAYAWRRWLLRRFGAKVGQGVVIRQTARVTYPWKVTLGDHCWIGDNAEIYSLGPISIGHHAVVSQRSYLCAGTHDHHDVTFPLVAKAVVVEDQAWVATDCFVAPGVTVGRGAIVAARSTVLHDVPPAMVVAGNPATIRKRREPPNPSWSAQADHPRLAVPDGEKNRGW